MELVGQAEGSMESPEMASMQGAPMDMGMGDMGGMSDMGGMPPF
jgi:hypothetical protein